MLSWVTPGEGAEFKRGLGRFVPTSRPIHRRIVDHSTDDNKPAGTRSIVGHIHIRSLRVYAAVLVAGRIATVVAVAGSVIAIARTISVGA